MVRPLDAAAAALPAPAPRRRAGTEALVGATKRAYAAGRERRSFPYSFVAGLRRAGATLVNPPAAAVRHFLTLEQLELLRAAQIPIPRTLASNDPDAVIEFAASLPGPMVYKPLAGGGLCRRATAEDLRPPRLRALAAAPVMFQEEIVPTPCLTRRSPSSAPAWSAPARGGACSVRRRVQVR